MSQDPYKPSKEVEMGVPVDYQHNQQYTQGQYPPPPYGAAVGVPVAAPGPQHVQVDQYGRPIVTAVPMHVTTQVVANNANIRRDAQGNALCNKCSAPYPLPAGATSWRCRNCHELNNASVYGDECCIIL